MGKAGADWSLFSGQGNPVGDSTFASILGSVQGPVSTDAMGAQDPIAALESLMQNGTSLQTIVDQISQSVGASVQQQLAGTLPQNDLDRLKSSIIQQIGNALSPPGTAPPGTPKEQLRDLAARLRRLIATIASSGTTKPGQQNEIAGNILDAKSAKELPAQAQGKQTSGTPDVSSLVRSVLNNVVATLQSTAGSSGTAQGTGTKPGYRANPLQHVDPRQIDRTPMSIDPSRLASQSVLPQQAAPVQLAVAQPSTLAQNPLSSSIAPPITMESAPDLLARMLVRAAGADAKTSGNVALSSGVATQVQNATTQSPSALAARFEAALATIVQNAATTEQGASSNDSSFTRNFSQQFGSQTTFNENTSNALSAPSVATTSPLQTPQQTQTTSLPPFDATAVIEQMVKGMMLRTNSQGSSEIRLHLQPENLGEMSMKITVSGSSISASVIAANGDVRSALLSGHQQLARSLSNSGLTLSGFSVDVSGGDAGSRDQSKGQQGLGRRYVVHELGTVAASATSALSNLGPALLTGKGLELFNYLV